MRELNFSSIEAAAGNELTEDGAGAQAARPSRWASRDPNPTVQMSIRMKSDVYDRFRETCQRERYTNGDMLELMMDAYLRQQKKGASE